MTVKELEEKLLVRSSKYMTYVSERSSRRENSEACNFTRTLGFVCNELDKRKSILCLSSGGRSAQQFSF